MTPVDFPDSMIYAMHAHAARLRRRFKMVEHDDVVQEMWLWALSHPRKVARYIETETDNGHRKLSRALRNAGLAYCHKEKARKVGYDVDDLFFYSVKMLRELLPAVYDEDSWVRLGRADFSSMPAAHGLVNEGNSAIACLTDVSVALTKIPGDLRQLIEWTFRDNYSSESLAGHLDTTTDGARMRVQRALRRLQEELGGDRPDWAAAQRGSDDEVT